MVLEDEIGGVGEGGELGHDGGETDFPIDGEDLGVAADVGEVVVVWPGLDFAAVAAHELDPVGGRRWWRGLFVEGVVVVLVGVA